MCGPLTNFITGAAAKGGAAATSGFFGTGGAFSIGETLATVGTLAKIGGQLSSGGVESDLLTREADLTRRQGEFDVSQREDEARKLKSRQIVVGAKSGVRRTGSVLEVMNEAAEIAEREVANIEFGAGSGVQSKLFEAKQVKKAGRIGAASTALTSFGRRF